MTASILLNVKRTSDSKKQGVKRRLQVGPCAELPSPMEG